MSDALQQAVISIDADEYHAANFLLSVVADTPTRNLLSDYVAKYNAFRAAGDTHDDIVVAFKTGFPFRDNLHAQHIGNRVTGSRIYTARPLQPLLDHWLYRQMNHLHADKLDMDIRSFTAMWCRLYDHNLSKEIGTYMYALRNCDASSHELLEVMDFFAERFNRTYDPSPIWVKEGVRNIYAPLRYVGMSHKEAGRFLYEENFDAVAYIAQSYRKGASCNQIHEIVEHYPTFLKAFAVSLRTQNVQPDELTEVLRSIENEERALDRYRIIRHQLTPEYGQPRFTSYTMHRSTGMSHEEAKALLS